MEKNIRIPWPGWKAVQVIGHGGYGTVYEIERNMAGIQERAALKVVSIPKDDSEIENDYGFGLSQQEVSVKYDNLLEQYKNEYQFMMRMKGQSYIVSCDDFYVEQQENAFGSGKRQGISRENSDGNSEKIYRNKLSAA